MHIPLIEQVKIQAQVLVPLVSALRAELGEEREQRGGLGLVEWTRLVTGGAGIEDHQVDGLRTQSVVQLGPVGDFDQLVVGGEDGAEARQRGGGQSGGHMHERESGSGGRQEERRGSREDVFHDPRQHRQHLRARLPASANPL